MIGPHFGPGLFADGVLLVSAPGIVAPELVSALEPMPPSDEVVGLVGFAGAGRTIATRLDAVGLTPAFALCELAAALDVAGAAHARLNERAKRRLGWPPDAERLTADRWLVAYAAKPERWLLDTAGGLMPASLLRCCLIARPASKVELWVEAVHYGQSRVHGVEPEPAPILAESAHALLRRAGAEPAEERRQQA